MTSLLAGAVCALVAANVALIWIAISLWHRVHGAQRALRELRLHYRNRLAVAIELDRQQRWTDEITEPRPTELATMVLERERRRRE